MPPVHLRLHRALSHVNLLMDREEQVWPCELKSVCPCVGVFFVLEGPVGDMSAPASPPPKVTGSDFVGYKVQCPKLLLQNDFPSGSEI